MRVNVVLTRGHAIHAKRSIWIRQRAYRSRAIPDRHHRRHMHAQTARRHAARDRSRARRKIRGRIQNRQPRDIVRIDRLG